MSSVCLFAEYHSVQPSQWPFHTPSTLIVNGFYFNSSWSLNCTVLSLRVGALSLAGRVLNATHAACEWPDWLPRDTYNVSLRLDDGLDYGSISVNVLGMSSPPAYNRLSSIVVLLLTSCW